MQAVTRPAALRKIRDGWCHHGDGTHQGGQPRQSGMRLLVQSVRWLPISMLPAATAHCAPHTPTTGHRAASEFPGRQGITPCEPVFEWWRNVRDGREGVLPIVSHALRGSRIVNSLYSPTLLSTVMLPPCCC